MDSKILILKYSKISMNKINKRLNNKYEYNNIRVKEYRKLKYENKKEENLLLYLMNYLIILILLSPILSSYSIQLTIPKTDEPNNFVRILYNVHTGNPERIYLNNNEVQSNVSIIKNDGNYVTCNCNSDNCNIKLEWNDERVNLIGNNMFEGCSAITYINFADYQYVYSMYHMFYSCRNLTKIDNLNLRNISDLSYAFYNCDSLTDIGIYLYNIGQDSDINMSFMFSNCISLKTINFGYFNFNTQKVKYMEYMFYNCTSLYSLDLSIFNNNIVADLILYFNIVVV